MTTKKCYLVWSNEHESYWAPNSAGYVRHVDKAGRYTFEQAVQICHGANQGCCHDPQETMLLDPASYPEFVTEHINGIKTVAEDVLDASH